MTEDALRNRVGVFLILSNLAVVFTALCFYFLGGFLFEEITTTIALIVPMFSVYTTAIVRSFVAHRRSTEDTSPKVSGTYVFIAWLFPVVFTAYLVALVVLKSYSIGFATFEQFKALLIASETVFGAYVGLVLSSMFRIEKQSAQVQPKTRSS